MSVQDGAGIFSVPAWSVPPPGATDIFAGLRPKLLDFLLHNRLPARLRYLCDLHSSESLFQASEVSSLRGIFELWLESLPKPRQVSWCVSEGQPYCLEALQLVSALVSDRDTALFPCLLSGVPTGFDADIPLSNVLVPQGAGHPFAQEIAICHSNWSSAEADPETFALVEEELEKKGWLFEVDSLASAQERFGSKLAIGKMSIVNAPGKKPRLVVDSTVCGTNPSCVTPETFSLPSVDDVRECFPLRMHAGKLAVPCLHTKLDSCSRASAGSRPQCLRSQDLTLRSLCDGLFGSLHNLAGTIWFPCCVRIALGMMDEATRVSWPEVHPTPTTFMGLDHEPHNCTVCVRPLQS